MRETTHGIRGERRYVLSNRKKLLITGIVTAAILIAVWLLLPNPMDPVPPLDNNGGDNWTQIDKPEPESEPEPEPDTHNYSNDHGCQGLDQGEKVGLHERCDD